MAKRVTGTFLKKFVCGSRARLASQPPIELAKRATSRGIRESLVKSKASCERPPTTQAPMNTWYHAAFFRLPSFVISCQTDATVQCPSDFLNVQWNFSRNKDVARCWLVNVSVGFMANASTKLSVCTSSSSNNENVPLWWLRCVAFCF